MLKRMDWLGARRVRAYLPILAVLNVVVLVVLVATSRDGIDRNGFLLGTDFLSFWTTGHMLATGGDVYDKAAHIAAQRGYFASDSGYTAFFYPPAFLPFCRPLGLLGYFPALAAWLLATGAAYALAVAAWLRAGGLVRPRLALLLAAFPPVAIVVTHGQTSFLVAALLGGGAFLTGRRPWLAGALLGLATIKPQFGLTIALALLLAREWRTIGAAIAAALALDLAAALAWGPALWPAWLPATQTARVAMEAGQVPFAKMITVFAGARLVGLPVAAGYVLQGASMIAAALAVASVARAGGWRWSLGLASVALVAAPLATPFALDYDLVLLAFPLAWLTGEALRSGFRDWEKAALLGGFVLAAVARPLGLAVPIPLAPAILLGLLWVVTRRALGAAGPDDQRCRRE